jgi:hypothetical protein
VNDGLADSAAAMVTVSVRNTIDPPTCSAARPSSTLLWPPNHQLVPIWILGVSSSTSTPVKIRILGVTQDEPTGQGHSSSDSIIAGLAHTQKPGGDHDDDDHDDHDDHLHASPDAFNLGSAVLLRAERTAPGDGRVYRIAFTATDSFGGSCSGSVAVGVPNNKGNKWFLVDSGQYYDATKKR